MARRPGAGALGAATVLAAGLVLGTGPAAQAHADIAWTAPAAGERVEAAPAELVLHLTESVVPERTTVTLTDASGARVAAGTPRLTRDDTLDVRSPVSLHVPLPRLAASAYHVDWRTVSSDDMHSTYGSFVFGVGADVAAADAATRHAGTPGARGPLEAALRWLGFLGLAALLGAGTVDRLAGGRRPELRRWAWRGGVLAAAAAAGSGALLLTTDASAVTASRYGIVWATHIALLCVAAALARCAARPYGDSDEDSDGEGDTPQRAGRVHRWQAAAMATAVAAAAVAALVGHAAGAATRPGWTAAVTGAHLVATALWTGMLLAVAVDRGRAEVLPRIAPVAVPAVAVSVLSGLLLAGLLVPSVGALTGSGYGRLVTVKVVFVAVAAALGGLNAVRARRRLRAGAGVRLVTAEAVALVAVLAAAAGLGALAPPTSPRWAPTPSWVADAEPRTAAVDDLLVTVSVTPNRPGSAFVAAQVVSTRRPAPGPVTGVEMRVGAAPAVRAADGGAGVWLTPAVNLTRSGPIMITVTVHRADLTDSAVGTRWTIAPRPGTQAAGAPTAPAVRWAVAAVGLLAAAAAAGAFARARRAATRAATRVGGGRSGRAGRSRDDVRVMRVAQTAPVRHSGDVTAVEELCGDTARR